RASFRATSSCGQFASRHGVHARVRRDEPQSLACGVGSGAQAGESGGHDRRRLVVQDGHPHDLAARERFMADSGRWHLERAPDERVALVAHNNHIMKTELNFGHGIDVLPLGHYLDHDDYYALALVHTADNVPEMYPDATRRAGFRIESAALDPPSPDSLEAALTRSGEITFASLRDAPPLMRMRSQSAELRIPVGRAFDGVLSVPTVTPDRPPAL